jgi:hypothetical protein
VTLSFLAILLQTSRLNLYGTFLPSYFTPRTLKVSCKASEVIFNVASRPDQTSATSRQNSSTSFETLEGWKS